MLMVMAVIFGAHLLPFGWLYKSKAYFVMSIVVALSSFIVGLIFNPVILSIVMIIFELVFSLWLWFENKSLYIKKD
jgi:TRAP-type C4-dicarboxylate transport system permease small subunit